MRLEVRRPVTLCAIALALLSPCASEAFPSLCGLTYPQDFPCLPDGVSAAGPDVPIPGMKAMSLVTYPGTAEEVSAQLTEAAKAAGWQVDARIGDEPEGRRYRIQFKRAERTIAASIYGNPGQVLLQITEFAPHVQ